MRTRAAVLCLISGLMVAAMLFADDSDRHRNKPLVVVSAEVLDYSRTPYVLEIRGRNFGVYKPVVTWASVQVPVADFRTLKDDWQVVTVRLPAYNGNRPPGPGSYLLGVYRANKQGKAVEDGVGYDVFAVTIGAAGPQGPKGDTGAAGPQGPAGLPGPVGSAGASDGPCYDNTNRFVDCGNGTVTDTQTGLIWLKDPGCFTGMDYAAANGAAASLGSGQCGLSDGSTAGSWRLPTRDEWGALLMASCHSAGFPAICDRTGFGCFGTSAADPWAIGVSPDIYWSSTTSADILGTAWFAHLLGGYTDYLAKSNRFLIWPVR